MDIHELSKQYAEGKALNAMTAAIEQAYADGYNDGMHHRERQELESIVDGVEYVDLDLPSKIMWSSTYLKDKDIYKLLPYIEASKLQIPTRYDYIELFNYCASDYYLTKDLNGVLITGRNGGEIIIPYFAIKEKGDEDYPCHFTFWIKDDDAGFFKNYAYNGSKNGSIVGYEHKGFMGYKLPVMLVKDGLE